MQQYVYTHKTNCGEIFYVGKGVRRRAYDLVSRSEYHKRITQKYGCIVEIVKSGLTESEANELEIQLIAKYKSIGLCKANFTLGGDGRLGLKHSKETKLKMSKSHMGHPGYTKGLKMTKESSVKKSISIKNCPTVRRKPIKCLETGEIFKSLTEAKNHFNISGTSNISKVLKGQRSHVNGLRFIYV